MPKGLCNFTAKHFTLVLGRTVLEYFKFAPGPLHYLHETASPSSGSGSPSPDIRIPSPSDLISAALLGLQICQPLRRLWGWGAVYDCLDHQVCLIKLWLLVCSRCSSDNGAVVAASIAHVGLVLTVRVEEAGRQFQQHRYLFSASSV